MLPIPNQNMKLLDWADNVTNYFADYHMPILKNEDEWEKWAYEMGQNTDLKALVEVPEPTHENWLDWANEFYLAVVRTNAQGNIFVDRIKA